MVKNYKMMINTDIDNIILGYLDNFSLNIMNKVSKNFQNVFKTYVSAREMIDYAIQNNYIELLKYLRSLGYSWNKNSTVLAAKTGNFELIKWLSQDGAWLSSLTCAEVSLHGNLEMVKWLRQNGCPWYIDTAVNAAKSKNYELLKWVTDEDCPCNSNICAALAENNDLEMLKWAHSKKYPIDMWSMFNAAKCGNTEMIEWLLETYKHRGNEITVTSITCDKIIESGKLDAVKWLYNKYPDFDHIRIYYGAIEHKFLDIMKWYEDTFNPINNNNFIFSAVCGGHLDLIKIFHKKGVDVTGDGLNLYYAAKQGRLDIIKWLLKHGCEWDGNVIMRFIGRGTLEGFIWLINYGQEYLDEEFYDKAAKYGRIDILDWLYNNLDYEPDDYICKMAIDQPEVLIWIKKHINVYHDLICKYAGDNRYPELQKWCEENDYSDRALAFESAVKYDNVKLLDRLMQGFDTEDLTNNYKSTDDGKDTICFYYEDTILLNAIKYESINVFKWFLEHPNVFEDLEDFPEGNYFYSLEFISNLDFIKLAHNHNPLDGCLEHILVFAINYGYQNIANWAKNHNYELDEDEYNGGIDVQVELDSNWVNNMIK